VAQRGHRPVTATAASEKTGAGEVGQFDAALDWNSDGVEVLSEDPFGLGLGQEEQVGIGGVVQAEVEHGDSHVAAAGV
jgi:hypothetical protein